jgi:hypothetical protein
MVIRLNVLQESYVTIQHQFCIPRKLFDLYETEWSILKGSDYGI